MEDSKEVKGCPLWPNFRPHGGCNVTCCVYYTEATKQRCIQLDRKESRDGVMEPEEIAYYKGLTPEAFAEAASEAEARIKSVVLVAKYLDWLRSTQPLGRKAKLKELRGRFPFNVKELELQATEIRWLFDTELYSRFQRDFAHEALSQHGMLLLTKREFLDHANRLKVGSK